MKGDRECVISMTIEIVDSSFIHIFNFKRYFNFAIHFPTFEESH